MRSVLQVGCVLIAAMSWAQAQTDTDSGAVGAVSDGLYYQSDLILDYATDGAITLYDAHTKDYCCVVSPVAG